MTTAQESGERTARGPSRGRLELVEAILLALAALLTAWAAFQSTKWGGVQANSYSQASAARTESVRASNLANQQTVIDVNTFVSWVNAISTEFQDEIDNGLERGVGVYEPVEGTQSAFLYERFRPEFQTAFDLWIESRPLEDPEAAGTPFELPEYELTAAADAAALELRADELAARAREANQRGDNYVMMTILFALALVLNGVGSKLETLTIRAGIVALSGVALLVGIGVLLTFPIEV